MNSIQYKLALNLEGRFEHYLPMRKKRCHGCHEIKEGWQFTRDRRTEDGRSNLCKECQKANRNK